MVRLRCSKGCHGGTQSNQTWLSRHHLSFLAVGPVNAGRSILVRPHSTKLVGRLTSAAYVRHIFALGGDSECAVDYCIDCNPCISQLRAFQPCEFRCQRQILTYTEYNLGPLAYKRGYICRSCHSLYLADGEQLMLTRCLQKFDALNHHWTGY